MIVSEITKRAYKKTTGGQSLKFRCTHGPRKGQVRASPAACNAPININKSASFKKTRTAKSGMMARKSIITKRISPQSKRVAGMNKPRHRTRGGKI